jgi:hypothetical protein
MRPMWTWPSRRRGRPSRRGPGELVTTLWGGVRPLPGRAMSLGGDEQSRALCSYMMECGKLKGLSPGLMLDVPGGKGGVAL